MPVVRALLVLVHIRRGVIRRRHGNVTRLDLDPWYRLDTLEDVKQLHLSHHGANMEPGREDAADRCLRQRQLP